MVVIIETTIGRQIARPLSKQTYQKANTRKILIRAYAALAIAPGLIINFLSILWTSLFFPLFWSLDSWLTEAGVSLRVAVDFFLLFGRRFVLRWLYSQFSHNTLIFVTYRPQLLIRLVLLSLVILWKWYCVQRMKFASGHRSRRELLFGSWREEIWQEKMMIECVSCLHLLFSWFASPRQSWRQASKQNEHLKCVIRTWAFKRSVARAGYTHQITEESVLTKVQIAADCEFKRVFDLLRLSLRLILQWGRDRTLPVAG